MAQKIRLMVISPYLNRSVSYAAGATIEVDETEARFLQADAPGCFEVEQPEIVKTDQVIAETAITEPPKDKMVKGPARKK